MKADMSMSLPQIESMLKSSFNIFDYVFDFIQDLFKLKLIRLAARGLLVLLLLSTFIVLQQLKHFSEQQFTPLKIILLFFTHSAYFLNSILIVMVVVQIIFLFFGSNLDYKDLLRKVIKTEQLIADVKEQK
ncbi:Hypothetical_protein [Hexamita inflata]|uniref:Hypothetical_protein n=1 Tax=Hexamita inflata TaxID=28002 RepID=A0AA86PSG9_9EUKA|nr:Hypothetical protein HINF_LOCUS28390 [Hexamita inflata]